MKKTNQNKIEDNLNGRRAELESLRATHQNMVRSFQEQAAQNEARANFLMGQIASLEGLLPKAKTEAGNRKPETGKA